MTSRPAATEHHPYFLRYIERVPDGDLLSHLETQGQTFDGELAALSDSQWSHRYAPGKWTVKELVGHMIDTERIMSTRALVYARGETAPYPSFDEDAFAEASGADQRSGENLRREWRAVRAATLALMSGLGASALDRRGSAGGKELTVRSLLWLTAGHAVHHGDVFRQRYL